MNKENLLWMLLGINLAFSLVSLYDAMSKYPNIPLYVWFNLFANFILIICFGWFLKPSESEDKKKEKQFLNA